MAARTEAVSIALLHEIQSSMKHVQEELELMRRSQESKGEVYPEKSVSVTDKVKEIDPGVGKWRSVSIYNLGTSDCDIQINKESNLLTMPVSLPKKVSKEFSFTTEVIDKVFAKCGSGESTTLELEFRR